MPVPAPDRELRWLERIRDLSHRVALEQDPERLLPLILDAAIEITEAERGFLVRVLGTAADGRPQLKVEVARGFAQTDLAGAGGAPSRTVVKRVLREQAGVVTTRQDDSVLGVTSIREQGVLSILCAPLLLRGEVLGVLYLDHRLERQRFRARDLELLAAFTIQAALALEASGRLDVAGPAPTRFGRLVGGSEPMQALYEELARAARSSAPALILGEPGVGKELVARELHARGEHASEPFVIVRCSLPDDALAATLFGDPAAAPGSPRAQGAFVAARAGTVYLAQVDELDPDVQALVLDVLLERRVRPRDGSADRLVRCRVVASSAGDLLEAVRRGLFREDLHYWLDVVRLVVPPLRQRREDLPELFHELARQHGATLRPSDAALARLATYAWPGNLRELDNEVRRLALLGKRRISTPDLAPEIQAGAGVTAAKGDLGGKTLDEAERTMVVAALRDCGGNKARAARQLGIPRTSLYRLLERHGLT